MLNPISKSSISASLILGRFDVLPMFFYEPWLLPDWKVKSTISVEGETHGRQTCLKITRDLTQGDCYKITGISADRELGLVEGKLYRRKGGEYTSRRAFRSAKGSKLRICTDVLRNKTSIHSEGKITNDTVFTLPFELAPNAEDLEKSGEAGIYGKIEEGRVGPLRLHLQFNIHRSLAVPKKPKMGPTTPSQDYPALELTGKLIDKADRQGTFSLIAWETFGKPMDTSTGEKYSRELLMFEGRYPMLTTDWKVIPDRYIIEKLDIQRLITESLTDTDKHPPMNAKTEPEVHISSSRPT